MDKKRLCNRTNFFGCDLMRLYKKSRAKDPIIIRIRIKGMLLEIDNNILVSKGNSTPALIN